MSCGLVIIGCWAQGERSALFESFGRYMFLEEHEDESVTEIKSRDVNFLEA